MSLEQLIRFGYGIGYGSLSASGDQRRLLSRRFDITAVPADGTQVDGREHPEMLKSLLADRFKLKAHKEVRDMPIHALTVAQAGKLGPNLRESAIDCTQRPREGEEAAHKSLCTSGFGPNPPGGVRRKYATPLVVLVRFAQDILRDRPIVDLTGLTGVYEWDVTFATDLDASRTKDNVLPSIFTAFREQLGLKLEPRVGPIETLVIDAVEMPVEQP
jgi:uncharacterized protein (TIGR03435 family)